MSTSPTVAEIEAAREACAALCRAYCAHADAGEADALANLYTPDGVWTRHDCSNIKIEIGAAGRSAGGRCDLQMQRGREGVAEVEHVRAEYSDRFVLTEAGWRFSLRKVALVS
jgi:hypothetical protein